LLCQLPKAKTMNKILLIVKLSKHRATGFYAINQQIVDSAFLSKSFQIRIFPLYAEEKKHRLLYLTKTLFSLIRNTFSLALVLIKFKPKIVYFTISPYKSFARDFVYVLLLKLSRTKVVYHLHGKGIQHIVERSKLKKSLYKFVYKNTYVICLSELLTNDIASIYKGKPYIVNNGVPCSVADSDIQYNKENEPPVLLFLSNFIIAKGILLFIDALEALQRKGNKFRAVLVGDYSEISKDELQKYTDSKGLTDLVLIKGPLYGESKMKEYLSSDIFVFPTFYPLETWGLVILDAMQCELPVISTNEGAIPEIVEHQQTGLIVEKNNLEQLTNGIEYLLGHPEKRKEMGKAGREKYLQKYTLETFESTLANVFSTILNS
jgi:glycosyltransferase involved in cell wall biosynthesis